MVMGNILGDETNGSAVPVSPGGDLERSITGRLRELLSIGDDINLVKFCIYLDYSIMEGRYIDRVNELAEKYHREPQTIKNYLTEMRNMRKSKLKGKIRQIAEVLL